MLANYSVTYSAIDTKGINYFHIKILHLAFLHCAGPETDHVTYTQDIQVVNFSDISAGFVNVIIMYRDVEGRSVRLEALGNIDKDYVQTLDFLWQAMKRAAQEAPSDYSGPFSSLTLPTHNDLLKILDDLEL